MRRARSQRLLLAVLLVLVGCGQNGPPGDGSAASVETGGAMNGGTATEDAATATDGGEQRRALNAAFVVTESVFNSELVAPFDIFHHTIFRETETYIRPFIVSPDGAPVTTFEGVRVAADYSFYDAPEVDILVIPSTGNSMSGDLEHAAYLNFITKAAATSAWVVTLCDGAFPLAETGLLDGRVATTFPGDRDAFAERYASIEVRYDVEFVADGKYVTSVGGARSYEPALFVVESLYGADAARLTAEGMVIDWQLDRYPHLTVERAGHD